MKSKSEIEKALSFVNEEIKELEKLSLQLQAKDRGERHAKAIFKERLKQENYKSILNWTLNNKTSPDIEYLLTRGG